MRLLDHRIWRAAGRVSTLVSLVRQSQTRLAVTGCARRMRSRSGLARYRGFASLALDMAMGLRMGFVFHDGFLLLKRPGITPTARLPEISIQILSNQGARGNTPCEKRLASFRRKRIPSDPARFGVFFLRAEIQGGNSFRLSRKSIPSIRERDLPVVYAWGFWRLPFSGAYTWFPPGTAAAVKDGRGVARRHSLYRFSYQAGERRWPEHDMTSTS